MARILMIVRAGSSDGAALTSQILEFDSIESAEAVLKTLKKQSSSFQVEYFRLYVT